MEIKSLEPRAPMENEVPRIIQFLNRHLRPQHNWSITAEYPQVFQTNNYRNIRIIEYEGQIIAHAVIKYLLIKNHVGLLKVAAIGSVLTDPDFRHQGLSQKIMDTCLQAAHEECADLAVLWTDLFDFYRKMDFELAGEEISVVIENPHPVNYPQLKIMNSNKVSPEAILRVYNQHTCGTLRTVEDIRNYLNIPNSQIFTAWDNNNQLRAYAVEGKGADLKGYIHEWGGGVQELMVLFSHIRNELKKPITIILPSHSTNLIQHLQKWDVTYIPGFLAMFRPIYYEGLFFKVYRHARRLGIYDFVLEKTNDGFLFGTKNDQINIPTVGQLTRLLFGPVDKKNLKPEFQNLLPIPMWVWGWDSV